LKGDGLHAGVLLINDKSHKRIRDVEEGNLQLEHDHGLLQPKVADYMGVSCLAGENGAQTQEMDALHKRHDELVAGFAQAQSKSNDAIKPILQESGTLRKQNYPGPFLK
jgi:hypothetical protein